MKELIYCEKCHNKKRVMSYEKAVKILEQSYPNYKVVNRCMSTCGLGKRDFFIGLDGELKMVKSFELLVEE